MLEYLRALRLLPWRLRLARTELEARHGSGVRLRVREGLVKTAIEMFNVGVATQAIRLVHSILLVIRTP